MTNRMTNKKLRDTSREDITANQSNVFVHDEPEHMTDQLVTFQLFKRR